MTHRALRSRPLALFSFSMLAALSAPAAPKLQVKPQKETAKKNVVVLVVPFSVDADDGEWTGFAAAELITDLFAQDGAGSWVSSKQLDSALRRKDLQLYDATDLDVALPLARAVGATDLILGQSTRGDGKLRLQAERYSVATKQITRQETVTGGADEMPALAKQLAMKLLDVDKKAVPMSQSVKAIEEAAKCWIDLVRYPLQPRIGNVPPLDKAEEIAGHCNAAVVADPKLGWAHAGVAVLKGIKGDTAGAHDEVKASMRKDRFEPWPYIADSFVARHAGDEKGSIAALEAAVKARPGFLNASTYLGEDRMAVEDYKGAVTAWDRVLKRSPLHPYALGQKAKALGYLHRDREALALTRTALDVDPGDPELLIELGSRQIDAKDFSGAEASLRQAMEARPPRPLAWLRLGYLQMKQNKPKDAHDTLIEALTYAYRDDEGRARGIVFADLAIVAGMLNNYNDAVQYLQQAQAESYGKLPCDQPAFQSFHGKREFDALCATSK